jgi:hypothetical protein
LALGQRDLGAAGAATRFLMGLPLAVIVFTQWWLASKKRLTAAQADDKNKRSKPAPPAAT